MAEDKNFSGIWHNKYGSEICLEVDELGRVSGKFRTAVGRAETQDIWKGSWFEVTGFANRDLISLAVNYHPAVAMSVISGKLVSLSNGTHRIETLSYTRLSLSAQDEWREINAASLIYEPGPAPVIES